jgi:DNA processing protein
LEKGVVFCGVNTNELFYQIQLSLVSGVGPVKAKSLIGHCGSASAVFKEKSSALVSIPEIGPATINALKEKEHALRAEKEIRFIENHNIQSLFFQDSNYPQRLKHCEDSPILLYYKGTGSLNRQRVISIVGTRRATPYGRQFCSELLQSLSSLQPLVVSGLAFGVDIAAHRSALDQKLPTVACVAHGLDKIYPPAHAATALEMTNSGGLLTEHLSGTMPDREFFPMRNRIIAGMADCTIVIETNIKGGSIITAYLAHSYGREVFAVPGRYTDTSSQGCNDLIKKNIAAILTSPNDLADYMGWEKENATGKTQQLPLFEELTDAEQTIMKLLMGQTKQSIDDLSVLSGLAISTLSSLLLNMEFKGLVKCLPGKYYST